MYGGRAIIRFPCNGDYCVSVRSSSQIRKCGASSRRNLFTAGRVGADSWATSEDARSFAARAPGPTLSATSTPEMTMLKVICAATALLIAGSSLAGPQDEAKAGTHRYLIERT